MKKILLAIFLMLTLTIASQSKVEANGVICGDINNDGWVNVIDVVLVLNVIGGSFHLTEVRQYESADLNRDGLINIIDAISIMQKINNLSLYPNCGPTGPVIILEPNQAGYVVPVGQDLTIRWEKGGYFWSSEQAEYVRVEIWALDPDELQAVTIMPNTGEVIFPTSVLTPPPGVDTFLVNVSACPIGMTASECGEADDDVKSYATGSGLPFFIGNAPPTS